MTTKEMTYQYRLAQWSDLVKERVELGLSIRGYYAKKGFAENIYFYWQRRLREATGTQLETEQASLPVPGFVKVAAPPASKAPERQAQTGQLQVQIDGILLRADSGYPPEKLAALLQALSGPC